MITPILDVLYPQILSHVFSLIKTYRENLKILSLIFLLSTGYTVQVYGQTYYVSPTGNDASPGTVAAPWKTIKKAADTLVAGQTVYIRAGTYYETVTATRSGTAAGFITYAAYPGDPMPVINGNGTAGILFNINGKSYLSIHGLRLENGKHKGFGSETGTPISNIKIENCEVVNFGRPGISLKDCSVALIKGNILDNVVNLPTGAGECLTLDNCEFVDVVNNTIRNCTTSTRGGEGICIKASRNVRVYGNYLHDNLHTNALPERPAIYIDSYGGFARNITVFNNRISRCGSGIIVTGELRNAISFVRVYNNIINDTINYPIGVVEWGDNTVMAWPNLPVKDVIIENNTVVNTGGWPTSWKPAIVVAAALAKGIIIRNNLMFNYSPALSITPQTAEISIFNNFANSNDGLSQPSLGATGVTGNPKFVDALFRIASDSAVRGRGAKPAMASFDYQYQARNTPSVDIGAHQYIAPPATLPLVSIGTMQKPTDYTVINLPVPAGAHDAVQLTTTGTVNLSGTSARVSYTSAIDKSVGAIRFPNLQIPKGATVLSAWLTINAKTVTHATSKVDVIGIWAESSGNSPPLTVAQNNLSNRVKSSAYFNAYTKYSGTQKIGDIGNIISEVVNRADWSRGNALTLLLESYTAPCSLEFYTTESGATFAPVLNVEYTMESGLSIASFGPSTLKLRHNKYTSTDANLVKTYQWSTDLVEWKTDGQANSLGTTVEIKENSITDSVIPANDVIEVVYTIRSGPLGKLFARILVTAPTG